MGSTFPRTLPQKGAFALPAFHVPLSFTLSFMKVQFCEFFALLSRRHKGGSFVNAPLELSTTFLP